MTNEERLKFRDKAVASHHNNAGLFADRYEALVENPYQDAFIYGRKKILELIIPLIKEKIEPGAAVLDVGAGTGYLANRLSREGYDVKAIEPAKGMREQAAKRYPELDIIDGQVANLPFEDNRFSLVTAIEVFRYLHPDDIEKGYRECLRVLKPGGLLVITLVNRHALDGFILYYYAKLLLEKLFNKQIVNYCHFTTPETERKIFKKLGAADVDVYGRLFAPLRVIYMINRGWGKLAARSLERFDGWLSQRRWWVKFSGHLVVIVKNK